MEITNKFNLPHPIFSAIKNDTYDKVGDISVSTLIRSPRMVQLEKRHDKEITVDVSENLWLLLGSSVHAILERADTDNHLAEERLSVKVNGWTLSGKADLLDPDGYISDYKVTSAYSFLLGEKPEWEAQLNLYAMLFRRHSFEIKGARIVAILRDWMQSRAEKEQDYPKCGFHIVPIDLWAPERAEDFTLERVKMHQEAEKLPDDDLPPCTPEERWERPTTYAVMKGANKRATRVFEDSSEAHDFMLADSKTASQYKVVTRQGESVRCQRYCKAMQFCSQAKAMGITSETAKEQEAA